MIRRLAALGLLLAAGLPLSVPVSAQGRRATQQRVDLATEVAGTYHGDVISDARGSSRQGVTIIVTRAGPNLVEVSSDYPRIPTVRIRIERAMNAIVQSGTDYVFLIQRDVDPDRLSLTIDDASLSVSRR